MPWTKVKHLGNHATKSGATFSTITLAGTVPVGNQVVVFAHGLTQSTSIASCADSRGNVYTRFFDLDVAVGREAFFVSTLTTALQIGDVITVTYAASVNTRAITVDEWSGGTDDIAAGYLDTGQTAPSAAHMEAPARSGVAAGDLVIGLIAASNATDNWVPVADLNWTLHGVASTGISGTNRSLAILAQVAPSAGTYTPGLTNGITARSHDGISFSIAAPVTGGATVTGAAALSGAGSLASSGIRKTFGSSALVGSGTVAASGTRTAMGAAALAGSGSLLATGTRAVFGAGSLTGAGSLSAAGARTTFGSTALAGAGSLSGSGLRTVLGAGALDGAGSLTAAGTRSVLGIANLAGAGSLAATGTRATFGAAGLVGAGALIAEGNVETAGVTLGRATLSGVGSLAGSGLVASIGQVSLSGSGAVSASGFVLRFGAANLTGLGSLSADSRAGRFGMATLSGVGSLSASGSVPTSKWLRNSGSTATFGRKLRTGNNPSLARIR
jgi:hypothetical protein